jgi:hypothetical protein
MQKNNYFYIIYILSNYKKKNIVYKFEFSTDESIEIGGCAGLLSCCGGIMTDICIVLSSLLFNNVSERTDVIVQHV